MNIYRKKKGLKPRILYNHAAMVVNVWDQLYVAESAEKGVQLIQNAHNYVNTHKTKLLGWKKELTAIEQRKVSKLAASYAFIPHRYDFLNFPFQMWFILTGKWKGPKGEKSRKRVYCTEFVAVLMDDTRGSFNGKTWSVNPLDLELNKDLYTK